MSNAKTILVPVDFSKGSEQAVQKAAELGKALGARLVLLHVYQLPVFALPDTAITMTPTYVADLTSRAQGALDKYRESLASQGIQAETVLVEGMPASVVVDRAKEVGASMIIMGTHGRSGFQRFLLGSTAERVVRTSTVPVLTVHLGEES